jgi:glutathione S-transferase
MSTYKLSYFDFDGGRAEPIRIALHAAGVGFEDHRFTFADFGTVRAGTRFNSVPVFAIDGAQVTQSNAICRYVGKMAGMYPEDDLQALYCDEVVGAWEDISHYIVRTFGLEGNDLKAAREKLVDGWLTVYLKGLDELLTRGGGEFFADNKLTIADLKTFVQVRSLLSGNLDHIPTDIVQRLAPGLVKHQERVASDSRVVAYYASRS